MEWTTELLPDGIERVILAGRMDSAGTEQIDPRFAALTETRPALIVVDLAQVPFLASVGIRTLLANAKALAQRGGRMAPRSAADGRHRAHAGRHRRSDPGVRRRRQRVCGSQVAGEQS